MSCQALELGDPTGSGQGSMCDVLLAQKASPEKAIEMADEAMRLRERASSNESFGAGWAAASKDLYEAKTWARKASALLILDRRAEARQAMDRALRILGHVEVGIADGKARIILAGKVDPGEIAFRA